MQGQVLFLGHITTASPFANSPAGAKGRDGESLLPRLPVGGVPQPAIMPSVLRAALRQCATEEVIDRLKGAGIAVNFHDFALAAVGGVKGSRKEDDAKVGVQLRSEYVRRQHLIGLFGAGESPAGFATGGWNIGPAIATTVDATIVEGSRRPLNEDARLGDVLDPSELHRAREFGDANKARSKKQAQLDLGKRALRKVKDPAEKARMEAELAALSAELDALKHVAADLMSDVAIGMPLPGYEVIGSGVTMAHRMEIIMAGDSARLGLALASLERFGFSPCVGAHQSHGCGLINAKWDVALRTLDGRKIVTTPLGTVTCDTVGGTTIEGPALLAALDDWDKGNFDGDLYRAAFDVEKLAATPSA